MAIILELTPAVQSGLLAQAQEHGLSLEEYAGKILEERVSATTSTQRRQKKTLLELFEPIRGLDVEFVRNPSTGRPVDL